MPSSRVLVPLHHAALAVRSSLLPQVERPRLTQARGSDPHLECVLLHVDPLDEELHDLRLFGGEQLVPDCGEFSSCAGPWRGRPARRDRDASFDVEAAGALEEVGEKLEVR